MYTALRATSLTLGDLLTQAFNAEAQLSALFGAGGMVVSLNSPHEMADNNQQGLSLWLFRLERDPERLNAPPQRTSYNQLRQPPLPLRLHYLMTPVVDPERNDSPQTEQIILGKVLQVFHDHPLLRGADLMDDFAGTSLELRVRLEALGLEEQSRVFDALNQSFQLAASYEVSVVPIDSALQPQQVTPVEEVIPEFGVIVR